MNIIEALLLAMALCVDSLVVSAATTVRHRPSKGRGVQMALIFAVCQSVFPMMGALTGDAARVFIEAVDHWVAFALLAAVGGKMVYDGIKGEMEIDKPEGRLNIWTMLMLGVATSIDSFAVGIGMGIEKPMGVVAQMVGVIGVCTFVAALMGWMLSRKKVDIPERGANVIAGCVLIGLGTKILIEHLFLK